MFQCFKWDIQSDDHCVLAKYPLMIRREQWNLLCGLAEGLYAETILAERELIAHPELHPCLSIPKKIRKLLVRHDRAPVESLRVMRFDFHLTDEGWRISEVNADVPGGYIEASGVTELMSEHYPECAIAGSPAASLSDSLDAAFGRDATIAMVHATVYFDDHQVMRFLGKHLEERGLRPVFVSPHQLRWRNGRAGLCRSFGGKPIDAIVRFYPSEWLPELNSVCAWDMFFRNSLTPISNPATGILIQSKRFPLVWNSLRTEMKLWRSLLPETRAVEEVGNMEEWVIKPVFGRVGEDIAISGCTLRPRMREILRSAKRTPSQWVAQRRFRALPLAADDCEVYPTVGVFVMNGNVAGAYGRIARKPLIDNEAQDIAILITPGDRM